MAISLKKKSLELLKLISSIIEVNLIGVLRMNKKIGLTERQYIDNPPEDLDNKELIFKEDEGYLYCCTYICEKCKVRLGRPECTTILYFKGDPLAYLGPSGRLCPSNPEVSDDFFLVYVSKIKEPRSPENE
jgi:hypothetical protein